MGASSLFGKCTEETVPQAELRGKGLCKEYLFHSHPLCVWQHVTCVFRGCHGWGSLIDSSVGPVVHTVAVGGSNSFYFHLVINYLLSAFTDELQIPSRWPHLSQCLVGCPIHAHPAKAMSHDHVLPPLSVIFQTLGKPLHRLKESNTRFCQQNRYSLGNYNYSPNPFTSRNHSISFLLHIYNKAQAMRQSWQRHIFRDGIPPSRIENKTVSV